MISNYSLTLTVAFDELESTFESADLSYTENGEFDKILFTIPKNTKECRLAFNNTSYLKMADFNIEKC